MGKTLTLYNSSGLPAQIKLGLRIGGVGATIWLVERTVAAGGSVELNNLFLIWLAGDHIRVQPTTANVIDIALSGAKLVV